VLFAVGAFLSYSARAVCSWSLSLLQRTCCLQLEPFSLTAHVLFAVGDFLSYSARAICSRSLSLV